MKHLDALNHDDIGRQITPTRHFWQPRLKRDLEDVDARQILVNLTGFFGVLAEWSRADKVAGVKDTTAPVISNESEVRHDR